MHLRDGQAAAVGQLLEWGAQRAEVGNEIELGGSAVTPSGMPTIVATTMEMAAAGRAFEIDGAAPAT